MAEVTSIDSRRRGRPEPLWREVLGARLRALRAARGETLTRTAERAGISPQYLSEIERGRKEPSSEMIAALAGALDTTLIDLTTAVAEDLRAADAVRQARQARQARSAQQDRLARPATPARAAQPARPASPAAAPPTALALAA